jgi:hypothetical protein
MQDQNLSITDLEHFIIVRLTHIYLLSKRLDAFISQETQKLNKIKTAIGKQKLVQPQNLMDIATKEGIVSGKDYIKLKEENPERFKAIFEQSGLILSRIMIETENTLFNHIFPTTTWSSLFLMSMSHLEYSFILICNYLIAKKILKLKLSDLSGHSTYEKFVIFISKVVEVDYSFDKSVF